MGGLKQFIRHLVMKHGKKFIVGFSILFVFLVVYGALGGKPLKKSTALADWLPLTLTATGYRNIGGDYALDGPYGPGGNWALGGGSTYASRAGVLLDWSGVYDVARVYRATSIGGPFEYISDPAMVNSKKDFNVTPGITYYYEMDYTVTGATGPMSNIVSVVVPPAPTAPSNLTATTLSYSSIKLDWDAYAGDCHAGDAPIYRVYRSATAEGPFTALTDFSYYGITPVWTSNNTYTDNSVTAATTYYYKVATECSIQYWQSLGTYNVSGLGDQSIAANATTFDYLSGPASVTAGMASDYTHVTVSWPSVVGATAYKIAEVDSTTGSSVVLSSNATSPYVDTAVDGIFPNDKCFMYIVTTVSEHGDNGSGYSSSVCTPESPPAAPGNVAVTAIDNTRLGISWNSVNLSNGSAAYNIYLSTAANGSFVLYSNVRNSCMMGAYQWQSDCRVVGLKYNTTYYVKIVAVTKNTNTAGVPSDAVSATTLNNAMVRTDTVSNLLPTSVTFNGTVVKLDNSNTSLTEVGFQYYPSWDFNAMMNYDNNTISLHGTYGIGSFSDASLTGLTPNSKYYYRAYFADPATGAKSFGDSSYFITPVAVSNDTPAVTVTNSGLPSTLVQVPNTVADPKLDFVNFISVANNQTTISIPNLVESAVTTDLGVVDLQLPSGGQIVCDAANWDGVIHLPVSQDISSVQVAPAGGGTATVRAVLEVGSSQYVLNLSKSARLLVPGQSGKSAGYFHSGVFTEITTDCDDDTQAAADAQLGVGQDCKVDAGDDLVIWTKHFSQFVAFDEVPAAVAGVTAVSGFGFGDTVTPHDTSILINNGNEFTSTTSVRLYLHAEDVSTPLYFRLSNKNVFGNQPWEIYATSTIWNLEPGFGVRHVYAQFRDENFNISQAISDEIELVLPGDSRLAKQIVPEKVEEKLEKGLSQMIDQETAVLFPGANNLILRPGSALEFTYTISNRNLKVLSAIVNRKLINSYGKVVSIIKGAFSIPANGTITKYVVDALDKKLPVGSYQQTVEVWNKATGEFVGQNSLPIIIASPKRRLLSAEPYKNNSDLIKFNASTLKKIVNKTLPINLNIDFTYKNISSKTVKNILTAEIINEKSGRVVYRVYKAVTLKKGQVNKGVFVKKLPNNQSTGRYLLRVRLYNDDNVNNRWLVSSESAWFNIELK